MGRKDGAVVRALAAHQYSPGSKSGRRRQNYVGLVPGTTVFPSPQNPTFPNSNSTRNQVGEKPPCGRSKKSLFIYFIF